MRAAAFVHVLLLGAWLSCLMIELFMELAPSRYPAIRPLVPRFHLLLDTFIEIPVALGVLATGFVLLQGRALEGWLLVKVAAGAGAVLINLACYFPVIRRASVEAAGGGEAIGRDTGLILLSAKAGIPLGLIAAVLGLHLFVG